jgi:hypothetical protein
VVVSADMVSMDDSELGNTAGQALFKLEENVSTTDSDITFNKLTLGLKIETNITIDEVSLGTFYRQDGNTCTEAGRFCTNDTGSYTQWNCTVSECGGITVDANNNNESPFQAGALVYGDLLGLSDSEKGAAAFASILGDPYSNNVSFNDDSIFTSGFEYTQDTDVHIRDLTMGRVIVDEMNCLIVSAEQATLSKPVMVRLAEHGVPVVICGKNYHPISITLPYGHHHQMTKVLNAQVHASKPVKKRIWKQLVTRKIEHQHAVLKHCVPASKALNALSRLATKVKSGDPENIEAQAAKVYWRELLGD